MQVRSGRAGRITYETIDDLRAYAFSPDGDLITTDGRDSDGARGKSGSHKIIANTARRAVGEQARSADN